MELASISAGENAMDIDKVCCFRDAISAAAPLIYGLTEESGFTEFTNAVREVQSELDSDNKLEEKLVGGGQLYLLYSNVLSYY